MRESVSVETAKTMVRSKAVLKAIIECFDGRRWSIVLRGRSESEFVVRSARQNPKAYAKVETALVEIHGIGLRHVEVDITQWRPERPTMSAAKPVE